jgi:hypothetical protein
MTHDVTNFGFRLQDYAAVEWGVVKAGLSKVQQPQLDGVSPALQKAGFVCAYDAAPTLTNFGGRAAPAFTHWTGTTVDYLYLLDENERCKSDRSENRGSVTIAGTYVVFSDLSDHLPIVTDLGINLPRSPP